MKTIFLVLSLLTASLILAIPQLSYADGGTICGSIRKIDAAYNGDWLTIVSSADATTTTLAISGQDIFSIAELAFKENIPACVTWNTNGQSTVVTEISVDR